MTHHVSLVAVLLVSPARPGFSLGGRSRSPSLEVEKQGDDNAKVTSSCAAPPPVFRTLGQLPSVDGHVSAHWLLIPSGCQLLSQAARSRLQPRSVGVAIGGLAATLGLGKGECEKAACLFAGSPVELLPAGAKLKPWDEPRALESWAERECNIVHVGFVSAARYDSHITWNGATERPSGVPEEKWRMSKQLMLKGGRNVTTQFYPDEYWILARLGDTFTISSADGDAVITNRTIEYDGVHVLGELIPHDKTMPSWRDYQAAMDGTWHDNLMRKSMVHKSFSSHGFATSSVPRSVWASMLTYHHNNRHAFIKEEWNPWSPSLSSNFWQAPSYIIPIPPSIKEHWAAGLHPHIDAWTGGEVETEFTALYGMRIYTEGAVLFPHVDKLQTHVLSLVVNVEQQGMRSPWPIELDCSNHTARGKPPAPEDVPGATLKPGKMLLYESALCLHGRRQPLAGAAFTNFFVHFAPKQEPEWYKGIWEKALTSGVSSKQAEGTDAASSVYNGMYNEANTSIELWWLPPNTYQHGTNEVLIDTFGPQQEYRVNGRIGDSYRTKGPCEQTVVVTTADDYFHLCQDALTVSTLQERDNVSIRRYMDPAHVMFRNLCNRSLAVWEALSRVHFEPNSAERTLQPEQYASAPGRLLRTNVEPSQAEYINGVRGNVYCITYAGDQAGCTNALLVHHAGYSDETHVAYSDGSSSEEEKTGWRVEMAEASQYRIQNGGRPWLIPSEVMTKRPVDMPMHLPKAIGDELFVPTSSPPLVGNEVNAAKNGLRRGQLTLRALSTDPVVWLIEDFLSDEEADHIISLGASRLQRSTIGVEVLAADRTSRTAWVERNSSEVTQRISRRAADVLGVHESLLHDGQGGQTEQAQLVHYRPGQRYDAHTDWSVDPKMQPRLRSSTILMYLSTPQGGDTVFPLARDADGVQFRSPLIVHPKKGVALLFYNMLPDGNVDAHSLHMALPVRAGEKWVYNLWTQVHNGSA